MRKSINADPVFFFLVWFISILAFFITLYPMVYVLAVSFSNSVAINRGEVWLWPIGFNLDGYRQVLSSDGIWLAYGNTFFYTVIGTVFNIIATVMAAYPLSRRSFCGRRFFNFFIVFAMYFNAGLIPTYLLVTSLGFYNLSLIHI